MKAIATSLFATLALLGSVAHAGPSPFGGPDALPRAAVYADSGQGSLAGGDGSDEQGQVLLAGGGSDGAGQTLLALGDDSGQPGQSVLAGGDGSDDAGQTMLASGGGSDGTGSTGGTMLAAAPERGAPRLA